MHSYRQTLIYTESYFYMMMRFMGIIYKHFSLNWNYIKPGEITNILTTSKKKSTCGLLWTKNLTGCLSIVTYGSIMKI